MQSTLEAALSYASRGWPVLPVHSVDEDGNCSCRMMLAVKGNHTPGKSPYTEHDYKDASKEHSQIHLWWQMWPDANVAIATGAKSGLVVLDVDAKNQGYKSLAMLERQHGKLPPTVVCKTGGGGEHCFFKHPGFELRGRRGMEPGLDVMADGGRVVAAPSKHQKGTYFWMDGMSPDDIPIAPLPRWLLIAIQTKRKPVKRIKRGWY